MDSRGAPGAPRRLPSPFKNSALREAQRRFGERAVESLPPETPGEQRIKAMISALAAELEKQKEEFPAVSPENVAKMLEEMRCGAGDNEATFLGILAIFNLQLDEVVVVCFGKAQT